MTDLNKPIADPNHDVVLRDIALALLGEVVLVVLGDVASPEEEAVGGGDAQPQVDRGGAAHLQQGHDQPYRY